jgi:sugar phosphate isomerase/epimerase
MHDRVSVNALCFMGSSLAEMEAVWRELEPHRISFLGNLVVGDPGPARAVVEEGGYRVETITGGMFGGRPLAADEETWAEQRQALLRAIEAAQVLGARSVYGLTGGRTAETWEEQAELFRRAVEPCLEPAREAGIALMIENAPQPYSDGHIAHTLRDTITAAETAGVGVLIDIFGVWNEAGLRASIERAVPMCSLVQVSDYTYGDRSYPCRSVPGDGVIPLRRIIGWILEAGYTGAFDLELLGPRIDAEGRLEATGRAADNLSRLLDDLGV